MNINRLNNNKNKTNSKNSSIESNFKNNIYESKKIESLENN